MYKITFVGVFILMCFTHQLKGQNTILLENKNRDKTIELITNDRIGFVLKNRLFIRSGYITSISANSFKVNEKEIFLSDIKVIGPRIKGTATYSILLAAISGSLIGYQLSTENQNVKTVCLTGGICSMGLSLYIGNKNAPKKIGKEWVIRIK